MSVEVTTTDLFVKIGKLIMQVDVQEQRIAWLESELAALRSVQKAKAE